MHVSGLSQGRSSGVQWIKLGFLCYAEFWKGEPVVAQQRTGGMYTGRGQETYAFAFMF